ncbi:MAG: hypothetical protein AAF772_20930, partial [Acidobacteriota bacterium]
AAPDARGGRLRDATATAQDAAERARDAAQDAAERARVAAQEGAERARTAAQEGAERARTAAQEGAERARERYSDTVDQLRDGYSRVRTDVDVLSEDLSDYVRDNPARAIAFAAFFGFLIGLLLRGRDA